MEESKMRIRENIPWEIEGRYDVALLSAHFLFPPQPSIALSLYKARLSGAGISSRVIYPMFYLSHLIGYDTCMTIARYPEILGVAEFSFARLTGIPFHYTADDFVDGMFPPDDADDKDQVKKVIEVLTEAAELCVEETARKVVSMGAKVLAGSSIYAQQNATLAIFKRVKELDPAIRTIMGGTNLRDRAGAAVLRHYPSVDYVLFGEGDEVFDQVCRKLIDGDDSDMPYGVVRHGEEIGGQVPTRITRDMNGICYPDYSDFSQEWDRERKGYYGRSILVKDDGKTPIVEGEHIVFAEGSRGCWWGEKHCCTFCGLNGDVNIYRAKSPDRLHEELRFLAGKYPGRYIQLTDNIMSMEVLRRLIPELVKDKEQYRLVGEIKTNIREEDIRNLARAGFVLMQPGIESLNDHLLELLGKGNTAVNHIAFLKYSRTHGLDLSWNLLFAVPGERDEDYDQLFELLPKLFHFKAPLGPWEILFQRFSRYEEDPAAYGLELAPFHVYKYYYGDEPGLAENMFLYYELTGGSFKQEKKRRAGLYERLTEMVETWRRIDDSPHFHGLTMDDMDDDPDGIFIMDARPCSTAPFLVLRGVESEIYRLAWSPVSYRKILEKLQGRFGLGEIDAALRMLTEKNLMIYLSDKYLALALPGAGTDTQ